MSTPFVRSFANYVSEGQFSSALIRRVTCVECFHIICSQQVITLAFLMKILSDQWDIRYFSPASSFIHEPLSTGLKFSPSETPYYRH